MVSVWGQTEKPAIRAYLWFLLLVPVGYWTVLFSLNSSDLIWILYIPPQPPGNFEDLGHFALPLGMRGKHAVGTVEKRKVAGSGNQRRCCGGAPRRHAGRGGRPSQVAVLPHYTFKAKASNFVDQLCWKLGYFLLTSRKVSIKIVFSFLKFFEIMKVWQHIYMRLWK